MIIGWSHGSEKWIVELIVASMFVIRNNFVNIFYIFFFVLNVFELFKRI